MKISLNWLKQYVDCQKTAKEISTILTDTGLEVEGYEIIENIPGGLAGLVIGEVLSTEPHENADRLKVTQVNIGEDQPLQIVCGAPNVTQGQKVVVATVGATLHPIKGEPFKIKDSIIRKVNSSGMICAEDEIGLGEGHDGIMVLDADAIVGTPAATYFNVQNEEVIEIGLTPNRADGMSHFGVARDLVAALKSKGEEATLVFPASKALPTNLPIFPVNIENHDSCARYAGITLNNITVAPSPAWLQNSLRSIGLSPINNVVDITNFVNHEMAQPLHAFDLNKVTGNKIVVKSGFSDTTFVTLDGVERKLHEDDLMICNANEPMCIAGVFGGAHSGVNNETTSIFLESAYFNPVAVRKTAKRHGLNTDASFRFERGVDPNITVRALERAVSLLQEITGATITSSIVDIYPDPIGNFEVAFNYDNCNRLLGSQLSSKQIDDILAALEIQIISKNGNDIMLDVPAYRVDVQREVDVIEEVLRIYGFNNIEIPKQLRSSIQYAAKPNKDQIKNIIADFFVANGMIEIMSNSLTKSSYDQLDAGVNTKHHISMLNPLSSELDVMRQTILFSGLEAIQYNINRRQIDLRLFEFGKTYHRYESGIVEEEQLMLFFTGSKEQELWSNPSQKSSVFNAKSMVMQLIQRLGLNKNAQITESNHPAFDSGMTLSIAKKKIADIGTVKTSILKATSVKQDVQVAFVNWENIMALLHMNRVKYSEVSKFPESRRDLSLLINDDVTFDQIERTARKQEKKLLKEVSLFDIFKGKNLAEGKKSYAVSFVFKDDQKTLNDVQIDKVMDKITQQLEQELGASLR
ncbi:MAG: phenylalanyl-tRNA synthetase beta chain [Flavobacteriales bacterium]|jgi:phenylalanyl-tRNA synthetase beta chain